jgi:polysaccharide export outer membrane protein
MSHLIKSISSCVLLATLCACVGGRTPSYAPQHTELEIVKEIREKQKGDSSLDPDIQVNLESSSHISVQDYLKSFGQTSAGNREYTVGGNDVLSIMVYEEKDLSRDSVTVATDGSITFPLLGRVQVGGMTPAQIEERIARALTSEGYLVSPHVSVSVKEFRSKNVVVLGAVKNPGRYNLQSQETLLDILSRAGGVDFSSGGSRTTIMRKEPVNDSQTQRLAITLNIKRLFSGEDQFGNLLLQNEDVIFIPMAEKVYIMGEVMKPGEYVIEDRDATVIESIGMAGGFTRIAAPNRTTIIRMENGRERILTVPVDDITQKGLRSSDITLRDKDIVIVPESYF